MQTNNPFFPLNTPHLTMCASSININSRQKCFVNNTAVIKSTLLNAIGISNVTEEKSGAVCC